METMMGVLENLGEMILPGVGQEKGRNRNLKPSFMPENFKVN